MKYADMNQRQRKAFKNIYHARNYLIGGQENILLDYPEDSDSYRWAKEYLADHNRLVDDLYQMAMTELYDDGIICWGEDVERFLKDIRFCGKDWLLARCDARLRKMGY